jgi:hypothetical protein
MAPLPTMAAERDANDTEEVRACTEGLADARRLAATLPADDASRYFATRYLQQAAAEVANGETDECRQLVEQAVDEVKEHRHTLAPGEKLQILRPDE